MANCVLLRSKGDGILAFDKIAKQSVADAVFYALRQKIITRHFQVGDKLPSEGALCEQFGVSKTSVKLALQRLGTLGLIETRVGQGSFVLEFDPRQYISQIGTILLGDKDISLIVEYRLYVEMAIARLAMKKATAENFEKMEELIRQMDKAIDDKDLVLNSKLDYEFHREIACATQNDIFLLIYESIGKLFYQQTSAFVAEFHKKYGFTARDTTHQNLLQALKDKDIKTCRTCYLKMFSVFYSLPEEQFMDC
jgi:GntR family transcriptional repressor for pyruvate dehydrogenase complex